MECLLKPLRKNRGAKEKDDFFSFALSGTGEENFVVIVVVVGVVCRLFFYGDTKPKPSAVLLHSLRRKVRVVAIFN